MNSKQRIEGMQMAWSALNFDLWESIRYLNDLADEAIRPSEQERLRAKANGVELVLSKMRGYEKDFK